MLFGCGSHAVESGRAIDRSCRLERAVGSIQTFRFGCGGAALEARAAVSSVHCFRMPPWQTYPASHSRHAACSGRSVYVPCWANHWRERARWAELPNPTPLAHSTFRDNDDGVTIQLESVQSRAYKSIGGATAEAARTFKATVLFLGKRERDRELVDRELVVSSSSSVFSGLGFGLGLGLGLGFCMRIAARVRV
jgi:hypothetical protein